MVETSCDPLLYHSASTVVENIFHRNLFSYSVASALLSSAAEDEQVIIA